MEPCLTKDASAASPAATAASEREPGLYPMPQFDIAALLSSEFFCLRLKKAMNPKPLHLITCLQTFKQPRWTSTSRAAGICPA